MTYNIHLAVLLQFPCPRVDASAERHYDNCGDAFDLGIEFHLALRTLNEQQTNPQSHREPG